MGYGPTGRFLTKRGVLTNYLKYNASKVHGMLFLSQNGQIDNRNGLGNLGETTHYGTLMHACVWSYSLKVSILI